MRRQAAEEAAADLGVDAEVLMAAMEEELRKRLGDGSTGSRLLLAQVSPAEIEKARAIVVGRMRIQASLAVGHEWRQVARPEQLLPDGEWRTWLILAGRGWARRAPARSRSRSGSEPARPAASRWVAQTAADARDIVIEGPLSGLMATDRPGERWH